MTGRHLAAVLAGLLLAGCGQRAPGGQPSPAGGPPGNGTPQLASTDTLGAWLARGGVRIIDIRSDVLTYLKSHLPGAIYLNMETLRASDGGLPTQLLDESAYRALFSRLGIALDQPVVIYSAGETRNIDATFLAWLLAAFGHPKVYVLDGGYFKWALESRPLPREYPRTTHALGWERAVFRPPTASIEDVRRTGVTLVDARPPDQFSGEAGAQIRRGHIPGAISHYWANDLTQQGFGHVWKPLAELRAAYAAEGITPDRDIIAYCNSTAEASHVFFTLKYLLHYPRVRIYVGSWTQWAERTDLPIAVGPGRAVGR